MERHEIGEREAFELLRDQARSTSVRVVDVAARGGHRPVAAAEAPVDGRSRVGCASARAAG